MFLGYIYILSWHPASTCTASNSFGAIVISDGEIKTNLKFSGVGMSKEIVYRCTFLSIK